MKDETHILKSRIDDLKTQVDNVYDRECTANRKFEQYVLILLGVFGIIQFTGLAFYYRVYERSENLVESTRASLNHTLAEAEKKTQLALDNADERLRLALDQSFPKRAILKPLFEEFDEPTLVFEASIEPRKFAGKDVFRVAAVATYLNIIEGPTGLNIGQTFWYEGAILDYFDNAYGRGNRRTIGKIRSTGQTSYFGNGEGELISEQGIFTAGSRFYIMFESCEEAQQTIQEMVQLESIGYVNVKPIYRRIAEEPAVFKFNMVVEDAGLWSCEDIQRELMDQIDDRQSQ